MKRTLSAMLGALIGLVLIGCNTVAGAGKDLQKAGETIQGAAKR